MNRARAFTLVELLVVIAIIGILAAMFLPSLGRSMRQADRVQCLNNLRQIGIGFQQFADDHRNRYPMQVDAADGGAREAVEGASDRVGFLSLVPKGFTAVERELVTPKLLVCRASERKPADNFADLTPDRLSYRLATNALPGSAVSVLATDRNLEIEAETVSGGATNQTLRFDATTHQRRGNVLLADNHVEWLRGFAVAAFAPVPVGSGPGNRPRSGGNPPQPPATPPRSGPSSPPAGQPGSPAAHRPPSSPVVVVNGGPASRTGPDLTQGLVEESTGKTNQTDLSQAPPEELPPAPAPIAIIPYRPAEDLKSTNWWWLFLLVAVLVIWRYLHQREQEQLQPANRGNPAGLTLTNAMADSGTLAQTEGMKKFFTGAAINADLLITMLDKHGINARQEFALPEARKNEDEFSRETVVYVPEADYDRAYQLFYAERGDEL